MCCKMTSVNTTFLNADRFEVCRHLQPMSLVANLSAVVLPGLRGVLPARGQGARAELAGDAVL
jgi:hypothetical protein